MPEPVIRLRLAVALADGDSLELTNAAREDQRRLVESFLSRHSP